MTVDRPTPPRRVRTHVRAFLGDMLTPLAVYRRLATLSPVRFMFESVTGGEQVSRYSFLGAAPRELYRLYPDRLEVEPRSGGARPLDGPPLEALSTVLESARTDDARGLPFTGGFVGFFGFDLVRLIERLPDRPADPFGLPVAVLGRFDTVVVFDHAQRRVLAVSNEIEGEIDRATAERELDALSDVLTGPADHRGAVDGGADGAVEVPSPLPEPPPPSGASLDGPSFRRAVERAKAYIRAGDIFQVVLSRRFSVASMPPPIALYRALRMVNPSPYMVLLELPEVTLVGGSPEMLVKKTGDRLAIRPIAGTRPRGVDSNEDATLAEDLLADAKERAEHVMLVDLGRNDLGKVAATGSVEVATFMEIEHYSHVMHIVSSVTADLDPKHRALDALLACFPAGTLSGAPKIRAMEIIDELEPEARGPYGGAVGYVSYTGDVDTCITIRTLVERNGETSVTAGAGIVADSDPAAEERETENKAAAVLAAVRLAEMLESPGKESPDRKEGSE